MNAVVLVRTASGSTYVFAASEPGVHWYRLPTARERVSRTVSGWEEAIPRIVPGERLLIGNLRSTPVTRVEVLPA
jgi:hypothetical protein